MQNFLTKNPVPESLARLIYDQDVRIEPTEMAYYAYKQFLGSPAEEDGDKVNGKYFAKIDIEREAFPRLVLTELEFLDRLGLVVRDPSGTIFVSPYTMLFYRGGNAALFGKDLNLRLSTLSPPERATFFTPILQLLSEYTLPGRVQWLQAVRGQLPDSLYLVERYEREIIEMQSAIKKIRDEY